MESPGHWHWSLTRSRWDESKSKSRSRSRSNQMDAVPPVDTICIYVFTEYRVLVTRAARV